MSKKRQHHHGIVARISGNTIERIDPICVAHDHDAKCALGVCDEVVYEAPGATSASAAHTGWTPGFDANWERTFGRAARGESN